MKLENQVTSLEPSKKLKELGVKQESLWYWLKAYSDDRYHVVLEGGFNKFNKDDYSAFTVAELGEIITMQYMGYTVFQDGKWYGAKHSSTIWQTEANTEANARAKMLIYLIENKLIKPQ